MVTDLIADINYPFDTELLLMHFDTVCCNRVKYEDHRGVIKDWNIIRVNHFKYSKKICNDLGVTGEPRFYELLPHTVLPLHKDHNTQCSINVLLSGGDAPICFEGNKYYKYKSCLLNTQADHGVTNGDQSRILFKISIKDKSYDQVKKILDSHGLLSN